jgi:hypothetical protein
MDEKKNHVLYRLDSPTRSYSVAGIESDMLLPTYLSLKDSSCSNNLTDFCIHIHIHTDKVHKSTLNPVHAIIKAFRPLHKPPAASPLPSPTPTTAQVRLTHFSPREILSVVLPKLSFIYSNCEYSLWPVPPSLIFAYDPA